MVIIEQIEIFMGEHPMGEDLRRLLLHESKTVDYNMSYKTNVHASMTEWSMKTRGIKMMENWIMHKVLGAYNKDDDLHMHNTWFAKYSKEEYTKSHIHLPSVFSFVYFIQSPPGSSPLVFSYSKEEIEPTEGLFVMFPSLVYHHVPPNKCDDRIVLAGNISVARGMLNNERSDDWRQRD